MPKPPRSKLPTVVWAAAWVSFCADASTELIYGILPAFYLGTLSLGVLGLGLIEGFAESLVSLTKLYSGSLSDRSGKRKPWMLAGYGLAAISKPLLAFTTSGLAVGALRASDRFGKGLRGAPRDALIADSIDPQVRGRAFGVQRGMDHAGALVGGLVAAGLLALDAVSTNQLFLLSAIPGLAAVLVIVFFIRERPPGPDHTPRAPFGLRAAWRDSTPALRRYLGASALFALANSSDMLLLGICYERFLASGMEPHLAISRLPLLWALLHVVKSLGTPLAGTLSDRVGRVPLLAAAWTVYGAVYAGAAAFALGSHPAWSMAIFTAYALVSVLMEGPERALIADLQPESTKRGGAYGLLHFVTGVLALPATVIAAVLWHELGPAWACGAGAALAVVAAGVLLALNRAPEAT
ncbi:MAG: MFS transporter [Phycisphaerales bacterium JB041]